MKALRTLTAILACVALFASCQKEEEVTGTMQYGKNTYKITHCMYVEEASSVHIDFDADEGTYHGFCHQIAKSCLGKEIDLTKHFTGGVYDIGINPMSGAAILSLYNEKDGLYNGPDKGSPFKSGTFLVKKSGDCYIFKIDAVYKSGEKLKISFKAKEEKI